MEEFCSQPPDTSLVFFSLIAFGCFDFESSIHEMLIEFFLQTLVWQTFANLHGKPFEEFPVLIENVQFLRATIMPKEGTSPLFLAPSVDAINAQVINIFPLF